MRRSSSKGGTKRKRQKKIPTTEGRESKKSIKDLTPRQQRQRRKKWKNNSKKYRFEKKGEFEKKIYYRILRLLNQMISCFDCTDFCKHHEIGTLEYNTSNSVCELSSQSSCITPSVFKRAVPNRAVLMKTLSNVTSTRYYSDVYSDDSDDDEPRCSLKTKSNINVIKPGTYVLVEIGEESSKADTKIKCKYKYAAICQTNVEEEGEIKVPFLRICDGRKEQLFKIDENDDSFVKYEQIITCLTEPDLVLKGNRVYYRFPSSIDVFERA